MVAMARAELTLNLNVLEQLENRFKNPALENELKRVPAMKEIAALVAQAIADNFAQEGPGWAPLKGATIRTSIAKNPSNNRLIKDAEMHAARKMGSVKVSKSGKRSIDRKDLVGRKAEFNRHVDKYLETVEAAARSHAKVAGNTPGSSNEPLGNRQILRRTSLLYQTVATPTPGFSGSSKSGNKTVQGQNIYRVEGSNLVWGTNLIYAATHNSGDPKRNIPKREFLVIRDEWQARLTRFVFQIMAGIVKKYLEVK